MESLLNNIYWMLGYEQQSAPEAKQITYKNEVLKEIKDLDGKIYYLKHVKQDKPKSFTKVWNISRAGSKNF